MVAIIADIISFHSFSVGSCIGGIGRGTSKNRGRQKLTGEEERRVPKEERRKNRGQKQQPKILACSLIEVNSYGIWPCHWSSSLASHYPQKQTNIMLLKKRPASAARVLRASRFTRRRGRRDM
eukprot:scaffold932_cov139-Skeletonema_menzelii.AAC.5